MIWKNTDKRYGLVSIGFHWVIALIIIGLLCLGLYMEGLNFSPFKLKLYFWHKSFGMTVLVLAVLRVGWRLASRMPAGLASHQKWEKILAKLIKVFLYFGMFLLPLSGWVMSSANGYGVSVFGWFTLPHIVAENKMLGDLAVQFHMIVAYILIGVVALHIAGAVKHHVIDKDETLRRILPVLVLPFFLIALPAQAANWIIDHDNSQIIFEGTQMGAAFEGVFEKFDGEIIFDENDLENSYARITVDMARVKGANKDQDQYIGAPIWLDSESFPESVFKSEKIEKIDENQYVAYGNVTIKGIALPAEFLFEMEVGPDKQGNNVTKVEGSMLLKRLDFNVGSGEWTDTDMVANLVTVGVVLQLYEEK